MKITDIRTAVIAANFPWNLIRVYTDSGLVGLGEAADTRRPASLTVALEVNAGPATIMSMSRGWISSESC